MLVIAHRGNNKEALENSFQAYDLSVESGANRIELDVQLSKDAHAVINHDNFLYHTTGKNIYCSDLTRHELEKIFLINGQPIPFLDQVIERYVSKIEINIEIKGNNPESAKVVGQLIGHHQLREKIIVSCFSPEPLIFMRDHHPHIKRACLTGDDDMPWPFFAHKSPLNFMNMVSAEIIHPRMEQISEEFMDQCHHRKWQVYTWSSMVGEDENKESWWLMLKTLGVDGHCTNDARGFKQWLSNEKKWEHQIDFLLAHSPMKGISHAN